MMKSGGKDVLINIDDAKGTYCQYFFKINAIQVNGEREKQRKRITT